MSSLIGCQAATLQHVHDKSNNWSLGITGQLADKSNIRKSYRPIDVSALRAGANIPCLLMNVLGDQKYVPKNWEIRA